jgi:hypothetical protein
MPANTLLSDLLIDAGHSVRRELEQAHAVGWQVQKGQVRYGGGEWADAGTGGRRDVRQYAGEAYREVLPLTEYRIAVHNGEGVRMFALVLYMDDREASGKYRIYSVRVRIMDRMGNAVLVTTVLSPVRMSDLVDFTRAGRWIRDDGFCKLMHVVPDTGYLGLHARIVENLSLAENVRALWSIGVICSYFYGTCTNARLHIDDRDKMVWEAQFWSTCPPPSMMERYVYRKEQQYVEYTGTCAYERGDSFFVKVNASLAGVSRTFSTALEFIAWADKVHPHPDSIADASKPFGASFETMVLARMDRVLDF